MRGGGNKSKLNTTAHVREKSRLPKFLRSIFLNSKIGRIIERKVDLKKLKWRSKELKQNAQRIQMCLHFVFFKAKKETIKI